MLTVEIKYNSNLWRLLRGKQKIAEQNIQLAVKSGLKVIKVSKRVRVYKRERQSESESKRVKVSK